MIHPETFIDYWKYSRPTLYKRLVAQGILEITAQAEASTANAQVRDLVATGLREIEADEVVLADVCPPTWSHS